MDVGTLIGFAVVIAFILIISGLAYAGSRRRSRRVQGGQIFHGPDYIDTAHSESNRQQHHSGGSHHYSGSGDHHHHHSWGGDGGSSSHHSGGDFGGGHVSGGHH